MRRIFFAMLCLFFLSTQTAWSAGAEKLIISFEKPEVSKWPGSNVKEERAKYSYFQPGEFQQGSFAFGVFWKGEFYNKFRLHAAKGDATHGDYALSRKIGSAGRDPGKIVPFYPLMHRGVACIFSTQAWPPECFAKDWSGYDFVRMDVRSSDGIGKLWWMLEDELVEPPVVGVFAVPAKKWVTLQIDLGKAVKERGLDPARMVNIHLRAKGNGSVLVDNIRLAKKGAETAHALLEDASATKVPPPLPGREKGVYPQASIKPDRTPLKPGKPIVIPVPPGAKKKGARLVPQGWVSAFDNKHMMVAFGQGTGTAYPPLYVLQTGDGGKTWKGLDGGDESTVIPYQNADHGSTRGEVIDASGNGMFVSSIGCCGWAASPRQYCFMFTFKGEKGWEARIPPKGRGRCGLSVGESFNLVDSDIRHCVQNATTLRLDSGVLWHIWGHIGRRCDMGVHAKYSVDDGVTWHTWRHGKSAAIPGSFSPRAGNLYGFKRPWATQWRDGLAAFWQDEKGLRWSRFDGKVWSPAEVIDAEAKHKHNTTGYRANGSAVTLGKKEIFLTATNRKGVLRWDGKSWKTELPEAGDQGYLSIAGKTVVLVKAGAQKPKWYGKTWGRKTKLECWKRKAGGKWEGPIDLAGGEFTIMVYRGYPSFAVPRISPPNFVPVVWNAMGEDDLKLVRVLIE